MSNFEVFKTIPTHINVDYKLLDKQFTFSTEGIVTLIENAFMAGVFRGISETSKKKSKHCFVTIIETCIGFVAHAHETYEDAYNDGPNVVAIRSIDWE